MLSVAVSPSGRVLTGHAEGKLKLWDLEGATPARALEGHKLPVLSVAFAPDGRRAVSAAFDGTIRVWNVETGRPIDTIDLASSSDFAWSVAYAPDGRTIFAGTARGVVLRFVAERN